MGLRSIHLLCIFLSFLVARTQELPPIQNYSPTDYQSGNQNWSISQSDDKLIYIANNEGLLEFNGAKWTLYPSPNETIMRSVNVIGDRIYTGCYMEFGFWQRNELGVLTYSSLSKELKLELKEDEEFWNILEIDQWIVFQSLSRIYIYNQENSTVSIIESEEVIVKMFEVNESLYFQRMNKGIFKIENGADRLLAGDPVLRNDEVVNIFPDEKDLLIVTRNNGFYSFKDGSLRRVNSAIDNFSSVSVYHSIQLKDGGFALGTISNGVIILDDEFRITHEINQKNGLINNTALYLLEDLSLNLWVGLDNGVSFINRNSPVQVFTDYQGILGSVYASAVHNGLLYLGTNQGLFYRSLESNNEFQFLNGTQGQVWCLKEVNNELFCGHHTGTFKVNGTSIEKISSVQGTWNIRELDNKELILQGNYDGLYILEKRNGTWGLRNKIEGFNNSSRYFEVLDDIIFVNHEYKGVFTLNVDDQFLKVSVTEIDTLLKGSNSSIIKHKDKILFAYRDGIFEYDKPHKKFLRDSILSTVYTEEDYVSGRIVLSSANDKFWIFSKSTLTEISSGNLADIPKIKRLPITFDVRRNVVEYENIISLDGLNKYLIGTTFGYLMIDVDKLTINDFNIFISTISNGINEDHSASGRLLNKNKNGSFGPDENNFSISFHTPEYYRYFSPTYQYQLVGLYDVWSEWTSKSTVFFENLPPGKYTFNVRAKVGDTISENTASYIFKVTKPWYFTNFMIAIYFLGVIGFSIFMHNVYRRYYKNQQEKLIEENRRELELNKLQSEKEIIRIRNEQLEKDYKSKSNELAASTMSIIKKNELLTQIKEQLGSLEDKTSVKPVIRIIDKSLNHNENWELFKEAFDNADTEFFKNLKDRHPTLSPNDLKLCAYLRLNLSSKEVSQLINISPRSVEVKRYRLRKKLNLDSNENLTNYILSI